MGEWDICSLLSQMFETVELRFKTFISGLVKIILIVHMETAGVARERVKACVIGYRSGNSHRMQRDVTYRRRASSVC